MLALKSSIKMCSSVACFLTLCLAGFPWSTKHRGEARSRAVWSNKCRSPMNHWVLQSLICSLCAFWKQCTEHNAKLPKDTMIIIVLCCHHVPHTQAHPKVKGNLHSEVLLSSFVKDPSCPLIFKNVPQGMKTSAKTCVGLIVHPCIERERLSWDTRGQEDRRNEKKNQDQTLLRHHSASPQAFEERDSRLKCWNLPWKWWIITAVVHSSKISPSRTPSRKAGIQAAHKLTYCQQWSCNTLPA